MVDPELSVVEGHRVAEEAQHRLLHHVPRLTAALVHADPLEHGGVNHHELSGHHLSDREGSADDTTPIPDREVSSERHDSGTYPNSG